MAATLSVAEAAVEAASRVSKRLRSARWGPMEKGRRSISVEHIQINLYSKDGQEVIAWEVISGIHRVACVTGLQSVRQAMRNAREAAIDFVLGRDM
jgi:hypothetical protein